MSEGEAGAGGLDEMKATRGDDLAEKLMDKISKALGDFLVTGETTLIIKAVHEALDGMVVVSEADLKARLAEDEKRIGGIYVPSSVRLLRELLGVGEPPKEIH